MKVKIFYLFVLAFFASQSICSAQEKELSVSAVLLKAQQVFANTPKYAIDVNYKMFGNYESNIPLEAFSGKMITTNESTYLKIKNTVFLTNKVSKHSVKVFNEDKVIEVAKQPSGTLDNTSPVNIENFIKHFKNKKVEDLGDQYVCTLTTDYITQIPYGKVEIYIQKTDFVITKQVLYFLSKVPYVDHNGEQQEGNPRLEVTLNHFEDTISNDIESVANLSQYVVKTGGEFKPSIAYKDFKIIQN